MRDLFKEIQGHKELITDTSFNLLMKKRINKVLLICSAYDAFMLEEDGRIDEQIFNEYVSLNLRYPPQFIQASSSEEAFAVLRSEKIELVITMLSIHDMDPFELSISIKQQYPDTPIVVLTPFSREVSLKLKNHTVGAIDHVFCWLGNADILLAIIKLIEDKMNVEFDVNEVGVQIIILVEDSIRFYSAYLPNIYKIIFKQSKEFMAEGLNEHQKMLRMRGRPKILLATTYEEAWDLYQQFHDNVLGIISDVSYERDGILDPQAGLTLCKNVRNDDKFLPFLLQSSDVEHVDEARRYKVGFINKNSKTLSLELRDYIIHNFAFGDFIFRHPCSGKELLRAVDLQDFQQKLFDIPDNSFSFHINGNHISKWLNARGLFPIARMLKHLRPSHFKDMDEIRWFLFETISTFRRNKGRGIIAEFDRSRYDEYLIFTRIGEGSLGGKARGLAFIDSFLKRTKLVDRFPGITIAIPRTTVVSTDVFDEFMEENQLYDIALSDAGDEEILEQFVAAHTPYQLNEDLLAFIKIVRNPIAVRSSSLLEDSHYQPFAGIYSTYMLPRFEDDLFLVEQLCLAIKCVYASVFYKDSKAYMAATKNMIDEEKMGIVLQEVTGKQYGDLFYPTLSGVARSLNFYPIAPEKPEQGIASVAMGLGKYIVEGGMALRFSPSYPKKILQLSTPEMALRETQREFFGLDLSQEHFHASVDDAIQLKKLPVQEADTAVLKHVASTFDIQNHRLRDGITNPGQRVISFSHLLNYNTFPLAEILRTVLEIGQQEMNKPIEIEFAVNLDTPKGESKVFSLLQIRPIVEAADKLSVNIGEIDAAQCFIHSNSALGNGMIREVNDVVFVKPDVFDPARTQEIAHSIEAINARFVAEGKNYILIGPGRWGSSDPWLGIPVKWPQISAARVIIESGLPDFRIDPSQGTHFFQNLTSFNVGYFTINPFMGDGSYDTSYLDDGEMMFENELVKHVRFPAPLPVFIDGKKNRAVIYKHTYNLASQATLPLH
jgi:CheY-like chemotaxis protein